MKTLLTVLFLPFRVLSGNKISGMLFNVFKKNPWLTIVLSFVTTIIIMFMTQRG